MNRCARFPASRRARPCLRVRHPARLPLASELRLRTSAKMVATRCLTETHTGLRPRTPGRARGAAGKWPARFRRASFVTAFELPRDTTNTLSRGADVASSQRLDARGVTGMSAGHFSAFAKLRPDLAGAFGVGGPGRSVCGRRPVCVSVVRNRRVLHAADALNKDVGSWEFES